MRQEARGRGQPNLVSLIPLCPFGHVYTREQVFWEMQKEMWWHPALEQLMMD